MTARYSEAVSADQTPELLRLPDLWLLSDARNDAALERSLAALPPSSGFVFRHYHFAKAERRARFDALAALARARGHLVVLSDHPERAREWGADGVYGSAARIAGAGILAIATAHDEAEIAAAASAGAQAVMLSPVFATRSHPGGEALGAQRFLTLARLSPIPVIALGGMDPDRARELGWPRWAAIDGLTAAPDPSRNA
jgi:thiamine-phosphate pyrophosphorylase